MNIINSDETVCPHCGYNGKKKNPQGMLPIGTIIAGRYQIGRYMQIDGEGAVYLGFDNKEKLAVLIKEYLPPTLVIPRTEETLVYPKSGSEVLFKTTMYDFIEVYQNIALYEDTPGIVHVYGVVKDNGTVYAIKEYVKGDTLVEYLNKVGYMDFGGALSLLLPAFRTVEWMHDQNILHRGLSPENILVEKNGKIRINGFATQALRTKGGELKSALYNGYSAPEQYDVTAFQDECTDVYSLAAILYTCITGEVPQNAQERKTADSLSLDKNKGKVSQRQTKVIMKALSVNPQHRQQTVAEFLSQLQGKEPEKTKVSPLDFFNDLSAKQKQIAAIGAGCFVILILFLLVFFQKKGTPANIDSSSDSISDTSIEELTSVPNFVGMTYQQVVENSLYGGQFTFVIEEVYSLNYRDGEIADQTPAYGSTYTPGMTITLKVSKGEERVAVPAVTGHDVTTVINQLGLLGIRYEIMYVYDTRYPPGYVSGADKQEGYELSIERETLIIYVVRRQEESSQPSVPESSSEVSSETISESSI